MLSHNDPASLSSQRHVRLIGDSLLPVSMTLSQEEDNHWDLDLCCHVQSGART